MRRTCSIKVHAVGRSSGCSKVARMKAVRRFTVRAGLPEPLAGLGTLPRNLRWTWQPPTQDLFAAVDPEGWERLGDPLRLLAEVPAERLEHLSSDPDFLARTGSICDALRGYLS